MKPLGHRTYLEPKGEGEISMFGKPRILEAIKRLARRDPGGMVKTTLTEPKYPTYKVIGPDMDGTRKMANVRCSQIPTRGYLAGNMHQGSEETMSLPEGTNWAPKPPYHITHVRNAGLPTGREPYGNGVPVVVRGRESRLHGEGGQVNRMTRPRRYV
jgi:hypothetical protein